MAVEPLSQLAKMLADEPTSKSLVKKYLTPERVKKYENLKTKLGVGLNICIRNNAFNPRAVCPRLGDVECYEMFRELFDDVIVDYHKLSGHGFVHGPPKFGDLNSLPFSDIDPSGKYVVSTRVRVGRSVDGFPFTPAISKEQRLQLESNIANALKSLSGEHKGTYYPLDGMKPDVYKQLVEDHFSFKDDDKVLRDAMGYRDWPTGRGIFHNDNKTFLVWVNEEDHIRIISMEKGGDLPRVYKRLIAGIQAMEKTLKFLHCDRLGYLTCCPSNLGTTMRASVHVKIPKLSANMAKLEEICEGYNLQARGFHGEHTESPEGIYDISNKRRLGITELQAAMDMANGVKELIKLESSM